jgi:murein DD-endopeptidase MepM/ murein hydrolase activator NlpD
VRARAIRRAFGWPALALVVATGILLFAGLASARPAELDAPAGEPDVEAAAPDPAAALGRIEAGGDVLAEVLRAEAAVAEAEEAMRLQVEEAERIAVHVARAREAEAAARAAADDIVARLGPRLRARYRALRTGAAVRAMGADPAAAVRTERALDAVLAADLALLREARNARERLAAARASLEDLESAARIRAGARERARVRRTRETGRRDALVAAIRESPVLKKRVASELDRQDRRLGERLKTLPSTPATGVAARKGSLPSPCPEAILEVPFGKVVNLKFNTVTSQRGWDLRARAGTPVRAPAPGKVAHAAWFGGYGNLLIVDHGAGVHTLYAHLQDFAKAVGDEVREGEVVGRVGDTGSLKGAYLYFEIRQDGKAVDPAHWIGRKTGR